MPNDLQCWARDEKKHQQSDRANDVQVGQQLHALIQPGGHGDGGSQGDGNDDYQLHPRHQRDVEHDVQASTNLQHAKTNGDGEAEDGTDDADGVEKLAWPLVHFGAEQRREHRGVARGHLTLVNEVAHSQARQGKDHPHVNTEVVVGELKRLADGAGAHGFKVAARRVKGVVQRFSRTPEHQGCAHAGGKQHGEPDGEGILRVIVIIAEFEVAVFRYENNNEEDEHRGHTADVQPREVVHHPAGDLRVCRTSTLAEDDGGSHEDCDEPRGDAEDQRV